MRFNRAQAFLHLRDWQAAVDDFDLHVSGTPDDTEAFLLRARAVEAGALGVGRGGQH